MRPSRLPLADYHATPEMIKLPPELDQQWYNRNYYGTLNHNSRAVYQRYMDWYDGNPTTLDQLPTEPAAKKYVEYMGGAAAVIQKAKADFDRGEYRRVAEALKHVVFTDPDNREAKELLADAYEQLGYQAESSPWRSEYLQGAFELRNGVPNVGGNKSCESRHNQSDAAGASVRLPWRAAQWAACGGQEDRAQSRFQ
jgi:alkyl sulfatase BDS1-like metallo-beta-lactamase superfamily hydrolase